MRSPTGKDKQEGVGLVDLMISCLITGIVAAIAIPNATTGIANTRLRAAASEFSGLVQRARIQAVDDNATYTINFGLASGQGAYVDLNGNGSYDSVLSPAVHRSYGEPMIQFAGNVNQVSPPGGATGKTNELSTPPAARWAGRRPQATSSFNSARTAMQR